MTQKEIETTIDLLVRYVNEHWWNYEDLLESGKLPLLHEDPEAAILIAEFIQRLFLRTDRTTDAYIGCLEQGIQLLDSLPA